jgi:PD-(D/E)XK nuclease superfamily protein
MAYPKGSIHPKLVGDRTTAQVLARLLNEYEVVLLPFGENQRYDLVIEDGDSFIRVQCKTGRLVGGAVVFNACSSSYHHPNRDQTVFYQHHYRGDADYFGVYCAAIDGAYLVPVDEVGKRAGSLRIAATKNCPQKGIRWARDYELSKTSELTRRSSSVPKNAVPLWPA